MLRFLIIYRHAFLAGIISWLCLFLTQRFQTLLIFVIVMVVWLGFLNWFFYFVNRETAGYKKFFPLLIFTAVAFTALTALTENSILLFHLEMMASLAIGFLFFIPRHQIKAKHYEQKPWRRMMMMLWVFDSFAIISVLFALAIFFPSIPFSVFAFLGAVIYGYSALSIWQMYFAEPPVRFLLWGMILAFVMLELIWVLFFLPLGYLVLGFISTWIWYLLQLFIRFHLTATGVEWKKQLRFITVNVVLMVGFLFLAARWI